MGGRGCEHARPRPPRDFFAIVFWSDQCRNWDVSVDAADQDEGQTGKWNDFIAISNIYGGEGHFPLAQLALIEIVLTALFLTVIVSVTSPKAPIGFAPIAIGLTLTFIHLVAIPVDHASVNPARSTATAIFGGGVALGSLWLFWVAPIVGGVIGGLIARWLQEE